MAMILRGQFQPRHIRENDLSREGQSSPRFSKATRTFTQDGGPGGCVRRIFFVTFVGRGGFEKPVRYKGGFLKPVIT